MMPHAKAYDVSPSGTILRRESLWRGILDDLLGGMDAASLAARFHATLIAAISTTATGICAHERLDTVALTGGVFQNRLLLEGVHARLSGADLSVLVHNQVPANDGGIALGQAAIVASGLRTS